MANFKWSGLLALCVAANVCAACGHTDTLNRREPADSGADASQPTKPQFVDDGTSVALSITGGVVYDLVVDGQGNVIVMGGSYGNVRLAPNLELPASESGVFVIKLDSKGQYIWGRSFAENYALQCYNMALTPDDGLVIGCMAQAGTTVLGQALPEPNERDAVLVKLTSDGDLQWLKLLGGEQWQQGTQVAVGADGSIYVTGVTNGTLDFGGGLRPVAGKLDVFFAKFDATGAHVFSKVFGDAAQQSGDSIAIASNGDVLLAGTFEGQMDFGAGSLTAWGFGAVNFFVARFDASGEPVWNQRIVSTSGVPQVHLASMPSGAMVLCGAYQDTIQFNGTSYGAAGNNTSSDDGFMAVLDATGQVTSSRVFGGAWLDDCRDVAVTQRGDFVTTGDFGDVINLGGSDLGAMNEYGSFYARYDSQGKPIRSEAFLSSGWAIGTAISAMPSGRVALGGYMLQNQELDLGFAQLQGIDSYVVLMPE